MKLDEIVISRAIIDTYVKKLKDSLEVDAAIVGGGPSALCCAYYLARAGKKVSVFERKLSPGGGMWGGGMMFNQIVVQEKAKKILDEFRISCDEYEKGYFTADSIEAASVLCAKAVQAGAKIFNCVSAEDVLLHEHKVCGLVLNWSPVEMSGLHIDPLTMRAGCVIDATGHAAEVCHMIEKKTEIRLNTPPGIVMGEGSMCAETAEDTIEANSNEICPGLYVCGMCANAAYGAPRMGPIFGGMLLSGKKIAEQILRK